MNLMPFGKRLIIEKQMERKGETFIPGGKIVMPSQVKNDPPAIGVIVAIGSKVEEQVDKGDQVLYSRYAGQPVGDTECLILYEEDILGKILED